jgi:hypothetical protein
MKVVLGVGQDAQFALKFLSSFLGLLAWVQFQVLTV